MLCTTRNLRRKNEKEMKKIKGGKEREAKLESDTKRIRIFIWSQIKDLLAY